MYLSSGSSKKARTFDLEAILHETIKTAKERSQSTAAEHADDEVASEGKKRPSLQKSRNNETSSSGSSNDSDSSDSDDSGSSSDEQENHTEQQAGRKISPRDKTKVSSIKSVYVTDSGGEIGPPLPPGYEKALGNKRDSGGEIGPPLPPGYEKALGNKSDSGGEIGPPLPPGYEEGMIGPPSAAASGDAASETESSNEEDEESPQDKIPDSHEIVLDHGSKAVSALGLDPSGARLVTGSLDYDVKFWDFAGMDASLQSFRTLRPCESHQIKALEYSTTGDVILVISGSAQAKVIDRDGFEKCECVKGDQYLVDPASTKGHTGMLNAGCWNPKVREEFMTCSIDGTVRIWDINTPHKHKGIMKPKGTGGRRVIPTACAYSIDGRYMAAACQDGSIQLWDHNKHTFVNVAMHNKNAHVNGTDTSCLRYSYDGRLLASRGGDGTLKLWDLRNFRQPLQQANDLLNIYPMTDCVFSPDDRMIITAVSMDKGGEYGKVVFFDRETFNTVYEMKIQGTSAVRCLWHPKLNQMVLGCGDGQVHLYYDPKKSHRGAMLCVVRKKHKEKQTEMVLAEHIITPYALPMFRESRPTSTRKQEEKLRKDPVKSHRPDLPVHGPGTGGRVGARGATLSQYVAQSIAARKPDPYEKDPRGAILRHAKEAAENPYWVDTAYKKTQPVPVFQPPEPEKDDKDDEPVWKKQKIG
ncbi:hypothetical protein C0Q70_16871 [Pomacea canaliculata]|uniref:WD repeat-containing protein 70 n=1 Tax=Pomacea canaliculata TaxID=400727 RepID=A0A2T7NQZ9_POMCA|nr:hypothetical protein C0Q70_16871 [Pomacea canaliculata]